MKRSVILLSTVVLPILLVAFGLLAAARPLFAGEPVAGTITIVKEATPADGSDFVFESNTATGFVQRWGIPGTAEGQFNDPQGVGVDNSGNVYVADRNNHRVQKFDSNGNFERMWGWGVDTGAASFEICTSGCQAGSSGSGNGRFSFPGDVAISPSNGDVYVIDSSNERIQVFDSNGNFSFAWGSNGEAEGEMDDPGGIAIDDSGQVYVADTENHRIQMFDSSGTFLRMWGWGVDTGANALESCTAGCEEGIGGSGNGQFDSPFRVAVDGSNNVYVANLSEDYIQKFDNNGNILLTWGSDGAGEGEIDGPNGLAVDTAGNLYVTERFNDRVQMFDGSGNFRRMWGWGVDTGAETFENCTAGCEQGVPGTGDGQFSIASAIAVDKSGGIYVGELLNGNEQIQKFSGNVFSLDDAVPDDGDLITTTRLFANLLPASYTFTETATAGWGLADLSCDSGSWTADGGSVTVNLTPGDQISCTFSNSNSGTITIVKDASPADGTDFAFSTDAAPITPTFLLTWGSNGSGNGQLDKPFGVAVDAAGNVYVADTYNHRIQKFDSSGSYLTQWGSSGSGNGQFYTPTGVTVDAAGNVYVADTFNHRIQKFDSSGSYLAQWGSGGSGNGQFNLPFGVAVDAAGNVYVADTYNHRIQKFDSSGSYLTQWGSFGSGNGLFRGPSGMAVDAAGNVYVADTFNHRIQKFDSSGSYLAQWGSSGSGNGQFSFPSGVVIDGAGNVYVADTFNDRIQKFDSSGSYLTEWGSLGSGNGQFNDPFGVALDGAGNVYVADTYNHRIQKFGGSNVFSLDDVVPDDGDVITNTRTITGLLPASYSFTETLPAGWGLDNVTCDSGSWSADGDSVTVNLTAGEHITCTFSNQRTTITIIKEATPADGTDFLFTTDATFLLKWGSSGTAENQFNSPQGVAVDSNGNVYVTEIFNHRIQKFDSNGNFERMWGWGVDDGTAALQICTAGCQAGDAGSGNGQFYFPSDVAVSPINGNVYVSDAGNSRIQVFNSNGSFLSSFGSSGSAAGQLFSPEGLAFDSSGNLYVTESSNHRVQKFDSSGNFERMWGWDVTIGGGTGFEVCTSSCKAGVFGNGPSQFNTPFGVAVDGSGAVYVGSLFQPRIQKFDNNGNFLFAWGSLGSGNGQFDSPTRVAVDAAGNVYVADTFNNRIQVFDSSGSYLTQWGSLGSGNGQFDRPYGVVMGPGSAGGQIYVADRFNQRIQKFNSNVFSLDDAVPPDDGDMITSTRTFTGLLPVSYTFTETVTAGWSLDNITCDSGSWSADSDSVTVNLTAGQHITCTFSNSLIPTATDIIVTGFTANGSTTITATYEISGSAVITPFAISFYSSTNTLYEPADTLLSSVTITNPADMTPGSHTVAFTLGVNANLVNSSNETNLDYFLLAVADEADDVPETDADPHNEDNTAVFQGVYQYANDMVFVHGRDTMTDTITIATSGPNLIVTWNITNSYSYPVGTVTAFRARSHGDKDDIFANGLTSNIPTYQMGGAGDDRLRGGNGNDVLVGGPDKDSLNGLGSTDKASYLDSPAGVTADIALGNTTADGWGSNDTLLGLQNLEGSEYADNLSGNAAANFIHGHGGMDTINGRDGFDTLYGGTGGDTISGGNQDDSITGGDGDDILDGGSGNDTIAGENGNDTIYGGAGTDSLLGHGGNDIIYGGANNDIIYGGSEIGVANNDQLFGEAGNDTIYGGSYNDNIQGGAGADTLYGGDGDDSLYANTAACTNDGSIDSLNGGTQVTADSGFYTFAQDTAAAIELATNCP